MIRWTAPGLLLLLLAVSVRGQTDAISQVLGSSHTFAPGNPGPVTSTDTRACVFCHISHSGSSDDAYLWNQRTSTATHAPYHSPTMNAAAANPSAGTSKLCLSCHDGTVAVGMSIATDRIPVTGSMTPDDIVGLDLNGHHPTGIRPVDDGQLVPGLARTPAVSGDPAVRLPRNLVECTTCHDPHIEALDPSRRRFLKRSNLLGALCLACHDVTRPAPSNLAGWSASAHQSATHATSEYYGRVNSNACGSCHAVHGATAVPLLRGVEENACFRCHAGTGTTPTLRSISTPLNKIYSHPTTSVSGVHSAVENAFPLDSNRHAECADCHNSHAARLWSASTTPPQVPPPLTGVSGVDASGRAARRPAVNEYDICFKCHADSIGKPQGTMGYSRYGYTAWRDTDAAAPDPFNTRLEFTSAVARHNVVLPRRLSSTDVPSLRPAILNPNGSAGRSLAVGTHIYCGDCHNNDQGRNAGGVEGAGVHGSSWPHILERRNATEPPPAQPGGSTGVSYLGGAGGTAALCNKCHDIDGSTLLDRSFGEHNKHVRSLRTACTTCHDPHGVNGGIAARNRWLINFDRRIIAPSSGGILRWESTGVRSGRCYLRCHGRDHNPLTY